MKMDENVAKAVERVDFCVDREKPVKWADWRAIRARLVELEADNERLNAAWDSSFKQAMQNGQSAGELRARAEKADALLRESLSMLNFLLLTELSNSQKKDLRRVVAQITAHLSENAHG